MYSKILKIDYAFWEIWLIESHLFDKDTHFKRHMLNYYINIYRSKNKSKMNIRNQLYYLILYVQQQLKLLLAIVEFWPLLDRRSLEVFQTKAWVKYKDINLYVYQECSYSFSEDSSPRLILLKNIKSMSKANSSQL